MVVSRRLRVGAHGKVLPLSDVCDYLKHGIGVA